MFFETSFREQQETTSRVVAAWRHMEVPEKGKLWQTLSLLQKSIRPMKIHTTQLLDFRPLL